MTRSSSRTRSDSAGEPAWLVARRAIEAGARELAAEAARPSAQPRVGFVRKLGQGAAREAFGAEVELSDGALADALVALVPRPDPPALLDARTERELALLRHLTTLRLSFRAPRPLRAVASERGLVLVQQWLGGVPCEFRAGRMEAIEPWELVAELAAAVHAIDPLPIARELGGTSTRRAHGEELVDELEHSSAAGSPLAPVRAACAWMRAHLPPDEPAVLLHGDLRGDNVLVGLDAPPALIDWERARLGDPAHELAVVTLGVRRPFQVADGLERLLATYRSRGGRAIEPRDVRFHECALLAKYAEEHRRGGDGGDPMGALGRLENVLRALGA